jgi:hypothetical protein
MRPLGRVRRDSEVGGTSQTSAAPIGHTGVATPTAFTRVNPPDDKLDAVRAECVELVELLEGVHRGRGAARRGRDAGDAVPGAAGRWLPGREGGGVTGVGSWPLPDD